MEKILKIIANMDKSKKNYAVFDCDHTIISADVEHLTLDYMLKYKKYKITLEEFRNRISKFSKFKDKINTLVLEKDFKNLWHDIYNEYKVDIFSNLLAGFSNEEIYELTKEAVKEYGEIKRNFIENLFAILKENNIEIYICSASVVNSVYVASDMYNIKRENVLAIHVEDGYEKGIITRGYGKVKAIESLGYGYPPLLIAGDSDGDYDMMDYYNIQYGMIINANKETRIFKKVDNKKYYYHKI